MNIRLIFKVSLIMLGLANNVKATESPSIHSVTATVRVATEFCHDDTEAATRKAREYCDIFGYREDECIIISSETVAERQIYEPTGDRYSNGEMMYYRMACTGQATFKMEHKPLGLYDVVFLESVNLYSDFQIHTFSRLNETVGAGINFRLEEVADSPHTSSHMEFHMSLAPGNAKREYKLGKICIDKSDAYQLRSVRTIANDNFSLNLNYRETSGIFDFDGCKWNEVPLTGSIKLNKLPSGF